ncbi:MAG: HAD family phosphatase [Spirulina sp. SIO3F2]|nr:HAD family phosphatase [Spirulina sp. SIO3F2]
MMTSLPLSQLPIASIQLIATDMDGTLTQQEQFTPAVLAALAQSPVPIIISTGRSAGWVSGLAHYLPVAGAIAENGGVFFSPEQPQGDFLGAIADITAHRHDLAQLFVQLQQRWPQLEPSADNAFRLTDWTFDITALSGSEIEYCAAYCQDLGWGFTYSTVQGHLKLLEQDKAQGLKTVLQRHFPGVDPQVVLTIGDSPNDEPMFNPEMFPLSVGVANITAYQAEMQYFPRYLTTAAEGAGFCELIEQL